MPLDATDEAVEIRCAMCKVTAHAAVRSVDVPLMGLAVWLQMPPRWTALLPIVDVRSLHCRCPKHGFRSAR